MAQCLLKKRLVLYHREANKRFAMLSIVHNKEFNWKLPILITSLTSYCTVSCNFSSKWLMKFVNENRKGTFSCKVKDYIMRGQKDLSTLARTYLYGDIVKKIYISNIPSITVNFYMVYVILTLIASLNL